MQVGEVWITLEVTPIINDFETYIARNLFLSWRASVFQIHLTSFITGAEKQAKEDPEHWKGERLGEFIRTGDPVPMSGPANLCIAARLHTCWIHFNLPSHHCVSKMEKRLVMRIMCAQGFSTIMFIYKE